MELHLQEQDNNLFGRALYMWWSSILPLHL
jgi:hypothetical protein